MYGHKNHNGDSKVSYPTLEKARDAARLRSVLWGRYLKAYKCGRRDLPTHFHIGNHTIYRSEGARFHEAWDLELGRRAAANMYHENSGSATRRMQVIKSRGKKLESQRLVLASESMGRPRLP